MKDKVYISGKITGLPKEEVNNNFNIVSVRLKEEGYIPVSPLDNNVNCNDSWINHMKADIKLLMECNTIYLMKNWKDSRGAKIERELAILLGYNIIE